MKKHLILATALVALCIGSASAQYSETNNLFYFAQRTPQSNQLNPAFFPSSNSFYLQLPSVGTQLGMPLSINDLVYYDPEQDINIIDINRTLDYLKENNQFRFGIDLNLLGFGFRIHNLFVDFNTQFHYNLNLGIPLSMFNTLLNGNVNPDGSAITSDTLLNGSLLNMQAYLETSIGAGFTLPIIPLTIGVHAKLLSGIMNIQTDNTLITFETDEEFNDVTARIYYELMGASAIKIEEADNMQQMISNMTDNLTNISDIAKSMFDLSGNTGLAFDIGAKYELGPFTFSASINDLTAGIHWQKNLVGFAPKGGSVPIEFSGLDLEYLLENGNFNLDTLGKYFNEQLEKMSPQSISDEGNDYWYSIPTKLNLAATANFGIVKAGILFHGQFDRGLLSKQNARELDLSNNITNTFRFNTTVSAGINLFNWAELILATSIVSDGKNISPLNPGVGFFFTPATVLQTYFMLDYASSIYLTNMKAFNIKAGVNVLIGRGGKRKILGF